MFVYHHQSESWTTRRVSWTEGFLVDKHVVHACVHNGRMFAFRKDGAVFKMVPGSLNERSGPRWSPGFGSVGVDGRGLLDFVSESVLLG